MNFWSVQAHSHELHHVMFNGHNLLLFIVTLNSYHPYCMLALVCYLHVAMYICSQLKLLFYVLCVCLPPRGLITSGVIWCDTSIECVWLVTQVLWISTLFGYFKWHLPSIIQLMGVALVTARCEPRQTTFILGWPKRCGTLNSKFLFWLPPELGWAMIGDNTTSKRCE